MKPFRLTCAAVGAGVCAVALTISLSVPAQAATSSDWRVSFTYHYGATSNAYDTYGTAVAASASDAWAFGTTNDAGAPAPGTPVAAHWNGSSWQNVALPTGLTSSIPAASSLAANDTWAITEAGGDIWAFGGTGGFGPGYGTWRYNGQSWTSVTGKYSNIFSASAVSASNLWGSGAVLAKTGPVSFLAHYNGKTWQKVTAPALDKLSFGSVVAASSSDVWAAASSESGQGTPFIMHFNGTQWQKVLVPHSSASIDLSRVPDGNAGVWTIVSADKKSWAAHLRSDGHWAYTKLPAMGLTALAKIPGTSSLWGAGSVTTATGGDAAVWTDSPAS